jgi:hypothetical protein
MSLIGHGNSVLGQFVQATFQYLATAPSVLLRILLTKAYALPAFLARQPNAQIGGFGDAGVHGQVPYVRRKG